MELLKEERNFLFYHCEFASANSTLLFLVGIRSQHDKKNSKSLMGNIIFWRFPQSSYLVWRTKVFLEVKVKPKERQHKVLWGIHLVMEPELPHQVQFHTRNNTLVSLEQVSNNSPVPPAPEGQLHSFIFTGAEKPLTMNLVLKLHYSCFRNQHILTNLPYTVKNLSAEAPGE